MHPQDPQLPAMRYLFIGLTAIFFLALWAASFSHTCQSDGCIGIVIPAGGAFIALLVQALVLIPVFGIKCARAKLPYLKLVVAWIGVSLAAFVVPLLFAKL